MTDTKKKEIDGKQFVVDLTMCETQKDIFNLLEKHMTKDVIRDRVKNVKSNELVNALESKTALFNISNPKMKYRATHQDCMNIAAYKYTKITGQTIDRFKAELNKHITQEELLEKTQDKKLSLNTMRALKQNVMA